MSGHSPAQTLTGTKVLDISVVLLDAVRKVAGDHVLPRRSGVDDLRVGAAQVLQCRGLVADGHTQVQSSISSAWSIKLSK